jgi:DNA-binding transcriptional MerR regulator/effector-binding domain-containing protein
MKDLSQTHFTTGEFARLCGVSKHTLFHYDNMKIFSPETKGDNNYRYYSLEQIEVFFVITALKEIGMSLREIKSYLDRRSPGELVILLQEQEMQVNRKIEELLEIKSIIAHKMEQTKNALLINDGEINMQWQRKEYLLKTQINQNDSKAEAIAVAQHVRLCKEWGAENPYSFGAALNLAKIISEDYNAYEFFYTRIIRKPVKPGIYVVKPAGTYIISYHTGGYNTIEQAYPRIIDYAAASGLALSGSLYEDVLLDDLSVHGYDNYAFKLSVLVRKPGS